MSETPQFFTEAGAPPFSTGPANRALYRLPGQTSGEDALILVECSEETGKLPRNATSFADIAKRLDVSAQMQTAAAMAHMALEAMKRLRPGEIELEFGIELGGELGIPMVTKGSAKANFKVTLKWKDKEKAAP